jgi:hypothetical protein
MRRLHRAPGRNEEPPNDRPARRHNRARDAGRDVGDSVRILQELITENPRSEWCQCGHVEEAHNRRRRSKDCALCKCGKFRPG